MSEAEARLARLEAELAGHVRWIGEAAWAAPPGGNRVWDRVLARYGASADPPVTRLEEVAKARQSRGATLAEVRRALEAMSAGALRELDAIALAAGPELEARVGRLRGFLSRVADEETNRFAAAVCPPKAAVAASVGGIFANAQSTAKQAPWANLKFDPANVLECPSCGAPQERALDFTCRYCRGPMAAPAER